MCWRRFTTCWDLIPTPRRHQTAWDARCLCCPMAMSSPSSWLKRQRASPGSACRIGPPGQALQGCLRFLREPRFRGPRGECLQYLLGLRYIAVFQDLGGPQRAQLLGRPHHAWAGEQGLDAAALLRRRLALKELLQGWLGLFFKLGQLLASRLPLSELVAVEILQQ